MNIIGNEHHWLKKRFFDTKSPDVLAMTTNYMCNEWLDEADLRLFEEMKKNRPRRYQVAGLGFWGAIDGLVYENWEEKAFDIDELRQERPHLKSAFGLDFGYVQDPSALSCSLVDLEAKEIFIFDEMYEKGMSNEKLAERITEMGYSKEIIFADSAEPKSIDRLRELGLYRIRPAVKGRDSILNGIDFLQDFKIYVHPRCVNAIIELSNYQWDEDKFGHKINKPIDDFNHFCDALRYSVCDISKGAVFSFE